MAFYANRFKQLLANLPKFKNQTVESTGLGSKFKLTSDPVTIAALYNNPSYTRSSLSRRMVEHDGAVGAAVSQPDDRAAIKRAITTKHLNNSVYERIADTTWTQLSADINSASGKFDILDCIKQSLHQAFVEHYLGVVPDSELATGIETRSINKSLTQESFEKIFILNYFPLPSWLKNMLSPRLHRKNQQFAELAEFVYHTATPAAGGLLESLKQHEATGELTHAEVLGEIRAAFIGANTLAISLMWSVYTVGSTPAVHSKLRNSETYSRHAYIETLRLYPPFHMLTYEPVRKCPFHFGKKDPTVIVGVSQTHRSPENWEDADLFTPERFERGMSSIKKGSYIPFGGGSRACTGSAVSMYVAPRILRKLFSTYQFVYVDTPVVKRRIELTTENNKFFVQVTKL